MFVSRSVNPNNFVSKKKNEGVLGGEGLDETERSASQDGH